MNTACMGAHNVKPQEKYARVEREAGEFEEIHTEDAKVILAAFGICSRICLSTVERLRADGIKAGLFRPKTLFPFPKQQLARLAEECGQLIVVELANGQMTPTTILKQKTATTPQGRSLCNEGVPIVMAELINALNTPVFIERVSLADAPRILKARKAFKKALVNQIEKRGFSFVEVLSPCPVSWRMSPQEARKWLIEQMEPVLPVRNFRDLERPPGMTEEAQPESSKAQFLGDRELLDLFSTEKEPELVAHNGRVKGQFVKIAGFGGQGVMSTGVLMANCATHEGLNATWLPSYGLEMRGERPMPAS
jgi:hypothetical protein